MNVEEITAFKSEDGNIWEEKADAINSNIEDLVINNLKHRCESSHTNITEDMISQCCKNKKISYKGFIWKYKNKKDVDLSK